MSFAKSRSGGPEIEMSFPPGFSTWSPKDGCEIVLAVIDDDICPEGFDPIEIRRTRCRSDDRSHVLRQLDRKCPYSAGARVDQDFLSLLQIRSFDQHLPRVQAYQRDGGRFFHSECFGLDRHGIFIYRDEFRECTDSILIWSRIDLIARLESLYCRSDPNDDSRHIVAQNER